VLTTNDAPNEHYNSISSQIPYSTGLLKNLTFAYFFKQTTGFSISKFH